MLFANRQRGRRTVREQKPTFSTVTLLVRMACHILTSVIFQQERTKGDSAFSVQTHTPYRGGMRAFRLYYFMTPKFQIIFAKFTRCI